MIPGVLQGGRDTGIDRQQVGQFVQHDRQALRLSGPGQLLKSLGPGGVGEVIGRRQFRVEKVVQRLGEGAELVESGRGLGDLLQGAWPVGFDPVREQPGLANPTSAVHGGAENALGLGDRALARGHPPEGAGRWRDVEAGAQRPAASVFVDVHRLARDARLPLLIRQHLGHRQAHGTQGREQARHD